MDFLRTVAVCLVVIDHTCLALRIHRLGSWNPGWLGTLGVFIFFVHTTLVLMWSLERKPHTLDFYIRRVFRIYPLALLAIAIAVAFHAPTAGSVENFFGFPPVSWADIVTHCLLLQDLRANTPPLVNVMWTLPLEAQMYILLPMLYFFARQTLSLWPLLLLWLLTVAFCRVTFPDPSRVDLATVIPMFLPGVMAYVGFARWRPVLPAWPLSVLLAVLIAGFMLHPTNRRGWYFALVLGLALPVFREFRSHWITATSHHIAKYSYGIYLSHPFGLVVGMYLLKGHSVLLQLAVELLIVAVSSVLAYHLLEEPMIRLGARIARRVETRYERERVAVAG